MISYLLLANHFLEKLLINLNISIYVLLHNYWHLIIVILIAILFLFLEYKKARSELKKRSTDTLRLQKKARKGAKMNELHKALQDVSDRKAVLEETEKRAVREALVEERSRYCIFVTFLKPVLVSSLYYILIIFDISIFYNILSTRNI